MCSPGVPSIQESLLKVITQLHSLKKDTIPKVEDTGFAEKSAMDKEATYEKILSMVDDMREELYKTEMENDESTMIRKEQRDAKDGEASTLEKEFADFKREVAKDAVNSRTGKPIPAKLIAHFEELEREKEGERILEREREAEPVTVTRCGFR